MFLNDVQFRNTFAIAFNIFKKELIKKLAIIIVLYYYYNYIYLRLLDLFQN